MSQALMPHNTINRIHWLLTAQTILIIFASINRLTDLAVGYVAENEFLRWVDFNNMLIFPLLSLVAFYLLKREIEQERHHRLLGVLFITAVYIMGASYGNHEVTNYLHTRFCLDTQNDFCSIVIYNDDVFSHWVFFIGFILINTVLMLIQVVFPHQFPLTRRDLTFLIINGLFIALGVFANLGFEEIGFDLYIIVLMALLSVGFLYRFGQQPMLIYYTVAYCVGLGLTAVYRLIQ